MTLYIVLVACGFISSIGLFVLVSLIIGVIRQIDRFWPTGLLQTRRHRPTRRRSSRRR